MRFGNQVNPSVGVGSFRKGIRYYFAGHDASGTARFAWFSKGAAGWRVLLIRLSQAKLEEYLDPTAPKLVVAEKQLALPPWLEAEEGVNFDELEEERGSATNKPKTTYRKQATDRVSAISSALAHETAILAARDPLKELNRYSRDAKQNPHRFQLWFFAYILHGYNLWSLKWPSANLGTWSRSEGEKAAKKFGRPSADSSTCYTSPTGPWKEKIKDGYLKRCGLGKKMKTICREILTEDIGCKTTTDKYGNKIFYHPDNGPVFSYGAMRAVIVKAFGLTEVQRTLKGAHRIRNEKASNEGNFTKQYSKVLESLWMDAHWVSELPKSEFSEEPGEPLIAAIGADPTTGGIAGIGFSSGSEIQEAYRSALFFCVAPTAYLEKIYGLPKGALDDWGPRGLSPNPKSDRGPAGYQQLVDEAIVKFPIKSIGPSYSGQSNALVESLHPKDVRMDGPPTFVQSDKPANDLMKKEIFGAKLHNNASDISSRIPDALIPIFNKRRWTACPNRLLAYYEEMGWSSARDMSLHEGVRAFWTPMQFVIDKDGIRFRHWHFSSQALKDSGILEQLRREATLPVSGYFLRMVFRYLWIEVRGRLIEVEATTRVPIDGADFMVPISDVLRAANELRELQSRTRNSGDAVAAAVHAEFERSTGKKWGGEERRPGRPKKRRGASAVEAEMIRGTTKRAKAA